MSSFLSPLQVTILDSESLRARLDCEFTYRIGRPASKFYVRVPAGFETDFASIPRVFHNVLPPCGRYGKAAVVHDWLYRDGDLSRAMADAVFLEAMGVLAVPRWKRWLMYAAVRAFGWKFYHYPSPSTDRLNGPGVV